MGIHGISLGSVLVIVLLALLVFGTKRLRGIGSELGKAMKNMRDEGDEDNREDPQQTSTDERPVNPANSTDDTPLR